MPTFYRHPIFAYFFSAILKNCNNTNEQFSLTECQGCLEIIDKTIPQNKFGKITQLNLF